MSRIGRTLKGYLFWTYELGSFHYDVMVSLILAFIFIAPHFIDFKDQPGEQLSHPTQAVVTAEGKLYQVDAALVDAQDHDMPVDLSRKVVSERFGVGEGEVRRIEREGLDNDWPPLGDGGAISG